MSQAVDLWIVYQLIKRLSTPFNEMDAYRLGIIDEKGKLLKSPKTRQEQDAYTLFDRTVVNLKRVMGKVGLDSKFATYAAALFLIRESQYDYTREFSDSQIKHSLLQEEAELRKKSPKTLKQFMEDMGGGAPANATGAAVSGTGDDKATWVNKKSKGRPKYQGKAINGVAFLRRANRKALGG